MLVAVGLLAVRPLVVLVIDHILHFIPALSQLLPHTPISHHDVVVLIVLVALVVRLDAPHYIFCLPGMIPDVSVDKWGSAPDGLQRCSVIPCFLKA